MLLMALIAIGYGGYLVYQVHHAAKASHHELDRLDGESEMRNYTVNTDNHPISILILGVEGGGRADAQMVITLDPETNKIVITSIPRDTKVNIPVEKAGEVYGGEHKINAAYRYGALSGYGSNKLAVETVENLLDIPIDKYVTVGFEGFVHLVDAIGGVTVEVKEGFEEDDFFDENNTIKFNKGPMKLSGTEALAFVRMRNHETNVKYPRMERQVQFVKAAINETASVNTVFAIDDIATVIGNYVETNFTVKELYNLQKNYDLSSEIDIQTLNVDGENRRIDGTSYFIYDSNSLEEVSSKLKELLYEK